MAEINYLFSTVLMGLSLLAIGWTLTRLRAWQHYSPAPGGAAAPGNYTFGSTADDGSVVVRAARNPTTWYLAFVLLAFAVGGAAMVFISGNAFPEGVARSAGLALGALTGLLLTCYLFLGVYRSAMGRGMPSSLAAAVSAMLFGSLVVVVITVKLVIAG